MKKGRQQRSNIDAQEELCSALWDFARDVERCVKAGATFQVKERVPNPMGGEPIGVMGTTTNGQLEAVSTAMARISKGYGYRLLEIQ